jgi:hypothetical protein
MEPTRDVAAIRLDNALALFDEFVRSTVKNADAATLRGLERRFAERLQIQPSYWSQIKSRSRQIGERLARQFEQCCGKPAGWMDKVHGDEAALALASAPAESTEPLNDDERFIVGLVLTYYRRHPQRARARLLDLLGEVLTPSAAPAPTPAADVPTSVSSGPVRRPGGMTSPAPAAAARVSSGDEASLWRMSQTGVAPLKKKR